MARLNKQFIRGADRLVQKFQKLENQSKRNNNVSVIVGYTANYALYVHENIEMKWKGKPRQKPAKGRYWDPQGRGQSKFLEQPFREKKGELTGIVRQMTKATGSLEMGLLSAGLNLQAASQKLVPVDLGNLKASAFTRIE